jgi:hypothetical protein
MDKITATYAFFRRLEERSGFIVKPGERLVYTGRSRFPWLDPIFDEPPGIVAEVLRADYDPAEGPDYDPCDNHHHFYLGFFEVHEGICTTEIAAFFNVLGDEDRFAAICEEATRTILRRSLSRRVLHAERQPEQPARPEPRPLNPNMRPTRFLRA